MCFHFCSKWSEYKMEGKNGLDYTRLHGGGGGGGEARWVTVCAVCLIELSAHHLLTFFNSFSSSHPKGQILLHHPLHRRMQVYITG